LGDRSKLKFSAIKFHKTKIETRQTISQDVTRKKPVIKTLQEQPLDPREFCDFGDSSTGASPQDDRMLPINNIRPVRASFPTFKIRPPRTQPRYLDRPFQDARRAFPGIQDQYFQHEFRRLPLQVIFQNFIKFNFRPKAPILKTSPPPAIKKPPKNSHKPTKILNEAYKKLDRSYFRQEVVFLAKDLLGKVIVRHLDNGKAIRCRIVETEAYKAPEDKACHAYNNKKTLRTRPFW
jgi:hypothetical protein